MLDFQKIGEAARVAEDAYDERVCDNDLPHKSEEMHIEIGRAAVAAMIPKTLADGGFCNRSCPFKDLRVGGAGCNICLHQPIGKDVPCDSDTKPGPDCPARKG